MFRFLIDAPGLLKVFWVFILGILAFIVMCMVAEARGHYKLETWREANNCFEKSRSRSGVWYMNGHRRTERTRYVYKCEPEGREAFEHVELR